MFTEDKLFQARQDNSKALLQNLLTLTHLTVLKDWISKLCIKLLIKRKTRARNSYAYRTLVSLKTSVTCIFF